MDSLQKDGQLNAVGFLTNNFLAFVLNECRGVQWLMNQLILPLPKRLDVAAGDCVSIQFAYRAGCSIEQLQESVNAKIVAHAQTALADSPLLRAA